jgi:hypothetical protein
VPPYHVDRPMSGLVHDRPFRRPAIAAESPARSETVRRIPLCPSPPRRHIALAVPAQFAGLLQFGDGADVRRKT